MTSSKKLALTLAGFAGINIFLGFVSNWFVVTALGPGSSTDALYAGVAVHNLVLAIFSGSLTKVLVPLLTTQKEETFSEQTWTFLQGTTIFHGLLAFLLFISAPFWVPILVPGFDTETKQLTVLLTRIQLLSMVGMALTTLLTAAYHARERFLAVEISLTLSTVLGLGFLVWALPRFGVQAAAWTMVIRVILQVLFLIPGIGSYKQPDWHSNGVKEAWRRLRPLLIGTSYYKTDQLVDNFLASLAPRGGLSLLHMARQVYGAGHQILGKAIGIPMVPLLAKFAHEGRWDSYLKTSQNRTLWMLGLTSAGFLILLLVGKPALLFLFGRGAFENDDVTMLFYILIALIGFWAGAPMGQILSSAFYAKGNTKTPTKIGIFGFTIGIFLKLAGFFWKGIIGIAVGTSLYYFLNLILLRQILVIKLKKRISNISD